MGLAVVLVTACTTIDGGNDNPFASAGNPVTSSTPATEGGEATGATGDGSSGSGSTSTGDPGSTGAVDSSSGGPPLTTGVTADGTSSEGGGGNGMQPADGMYSACEIPEDCGFVPELCITIGDAMNPVGGFCSQTGCANPAVDCDPSPGGTAVPICVPVEVDGAADSACALQCMGGLTCPVPMQCVNVTGFGEICV